jgi:hypothetical protein
MSESPKPHKKEKPHRRFSDFVTGGPLDGAKIRIEELFDKEILIKAYRVKKSNFKKDKSEDYITIQFSFKGAEDKNFITFTGSGVILDQIKTNADGNMPFWATIRKIGNYFTLS